MPNKLQRGLQRVIGVAPTAAPVIPPASDITKLDPVGMFGGGPTNLQPQPPEKKDGEQLAPSGVMVVKSQVAERWIQNLTADITPEFIAGVLNEAVVGTLYNQFQLFETMEEKCPELRIALHKHKMKSARRTPRIVPPDRPDNPDLAKRKADHAAIVMGRIREWHRWTYNALDAVGKGISGGELEYSIGQVAGKAAVLIDEIHYVNHQHWGYWPDSPELQLFPNLLNKSEHIAIPPRKFVVFHHLSKSGHPSRGGMLRPLAWYFLLYLYAMKDWSTIAESYGVDVAWAFAKSDSNQEPRLKILGWLRRIAARAAVFDVGTDVHIERAGGSGGNYQQTLVQYCVEKMTECILGSSLPTSAGQHGARSLGLVQQDETEELIDWSCLLFAGTMTSGPVRWIMDFNFAEPGDNPVLELPGANRRDLAALANVINILAQVGMRIPEAWAHAQFDIPNPKEITAGGEPVDDSGLERILKPQKSGASNQESEFQNNSTALTGRSALPGATGIVDHHGLQATAQRALDALRVQAIAKGRDMGAFDQIAGPIRELVAGNDAAGALAKLRDVQKNIAPAKLEAVGKELFMLADLLGRAVTEEQAGDVK